MSIAYNNKDGKRQSVQLVKFYVKNKKNHQELQLHEANSQNPAPLQKDPPPFSQMVKV